jgi:glycosyltransferase involved in cell wall biosynthesis
MEQQLTLGVLVFNQSLFVRQLLESISNQTIQRTPLVIVDNCSSDGSFNEIKESLEKYHLSESTTLVRNRFNSGSAEGLRQLLELSQTKYMAVLHGDDVLEPNYVELVLQTIEKDSSCQALNVTLKSYSDNPSTSFSKAYYRPAWFSNSKLNRFLVCGLNPGVMPGSVLERQYVLDRELLEFPFPVNGVEDTLLWMRIIRSGGKIRSIYDPCYNYRIHESQFSHSDERNSFYFGFARRIIIAESSSLAERLLALSEINYEIKRFGIHSRYIEGLGNVYSKNYRLYSLMRILNVLLRRISVISAEKRYR